MGSGAQYGHALLCLGGLEVGKVIQYINLSLYSWISGVAPRKNRHVILDLELIYLFVSGFDPLICTYKSEPIYNHKAINLIFQKYVIYHSIHHLCLYGLWVGSGAQYGHALLGLGGLEVGKVIQYINLSLYSWINGVAPRKTQTCHP